MTRYIPSPSRRSLAALAAISLLVGAAASSADARGNRGQGSSYGLAGGLSPDLALANVKSGIYGVEYTYDRAHYDFNRCPPPSAAGSHYYTDSDCRR